MLAAFARRALIAACALLGLAAGARANTYTFSTNVANDATAGGPVAATAVFTVVNGVLLRPLPYPDPSRLAMVWMSSKQYGEQLPLSAGFYNDIAAPTSDVQKLATTTAFRAWNYSLSSGGEAEQGQPADGLAA